MSEPEQYSYDPANPVVLRKCYNCRKPQEENIQLKRCAGCAYVLYCSKECQKAAWPEHKYVTSDPPYYSGSRRWHMPRSILFIAEHHLDARNRE